jgi:hypothetical protein
MQHSVPPFLATIFGLVAAMFFLSPFVHWLALVQTSWAKHGGIFLGPPKRRLFPSVPLAVVFHPIPYLTIALIVITTLVAFGSLAKAWWWFLGAFYLYVAFTCLLVLLWHAPSSKGAARKKSRSIWPFDVMARRRYQRQYRAAWALFLVQGSFAKLSKAQQADVIQRVRALLLLMGMNIYVVPPSSPFLTYIYAAQMQALGIFPDLDGERWPLPKKFILPVLKRNSFGLVPRRLSSLLWKGFYLSNVYRRGGEPVDAAKAAIIARGLDVTDVRAGYAWPRGMKSPPDS